MMRHKEYQSLNYGIMSLQFGHGYIIGTKGSAANSIITTPVILESNGKSTAPEDWCEYIGFAEVLEPQSLYADQLFRRTGRMPDTTVSEILFVDDASATQANLEDTDNSDSLKMKSGYVSNDAKEIFFKVYMGKMNADVKKVLLQFSVKQSPFSQAVVNLYGGLNNNWCENTLNWNNRPQVLGNIGHTVISPVSVGHIYSIDITDYIKTVKSENETKIHYNQETHYITFKLVNLSDEEIVLHSTDPQSGFEGYRPHLLVEF